MAIEPWIQEQDSFVWRGRASHSMAQQGGRAPILLFQVSSSNRISLTEWMEVFQGGRVGAGGIRAAWLLNPWLNCWECYGVLPSRYSGCCSGLSERVVLVLKLRQIAPLGQVWVHVPQRIHSAEFGVVTGFTSILQVWAHFPQFMHLR